MKELEVGGVLTIESLDETLKNIVFDSTGMTFGPGGKGPAVMLGSMIIENMDESEAMRKYCEVLRKLKIVGEVTVKDYSEHYGPLNELRIRKAKVGITLWK